MKKLLCGSCPFFSTEACSCQGGRAVTRESPEHILPRFSSSTGCELLPGEWHAACLEGVLAFQLDTEGAVCIGDGGTSYSATRIQTFADCSRDCQILVDGPRPLPCCYNDTSSFHSS